MSIKHGHMCSKSFLTRSHLWFFNYKQKIFTRKIKKQTHKYIFIHLSFACIWQNSWINGSPSCQLQDVSMHVLTYTQRHTCIHPHVQLNPRTAQNSNICNCGYHCLVSKIRVQIFLRLTRFLCEKLNREGGNAQ